MNEKIKELAIRSGMEDYPTYGVNTLYGDAEITKFAELIVQECARVCTQENPDPRDSVELQCSNRIKEHFGIE